MPTLALNGSQIAYRDHGPSHPDTHTVILVHGSLSSSGQWRRLTENLSREFRVLAPDLHGYGASPSFGGKAENLFAREAEILVKLAALSQGPVHLVGHSYGGVLATHAAQALVAGTPGHLASLTLIEPVLFPMLPRDGVDGRAAWRLAERTVRDVRGGRANRAARRFVGYWHGAGRWYLAPRKVKQTVLAGIGKVAQEFAACLAEPPFAFPPQEDLPIPVAVVRGTRTTRAAHAVADRILAARPDARHFQIKGAGHMAPITHKTAVNQAIGGFLRDAAQAGTRAPVNVAA